MTEQANGPVEVGAVDAPAPQTTAPASTVLTDQGSNGTDANWVAGLQAEENRALVEAKQWKTPDDAIRSYRELEHHASKALKLPGENATAEDWDKFYAKLGRPETPDKYELKLDTEAVPPDFPYDETSAIKFRNMAYEAGLTPRQAQVLHDTFVADQVGLFKASIEERQKRAAETHRELVREWGDVDTQEYKANLEAARRASKEFGLDGVLFEGGKVGPDGTALSADAIKRLAHFGKTYLFEDNPATNANGVLKNPFSDEHENLTEQGRIIREDPKKAAALMKAAGKDPRVYGL